MNFFEDRLKLGKIKPKWLIATGFVGIGLIFLSSFFSSSDKEKTKPESEMALSDYEENLEEKIANTVEKITGAGRCRVMITFEQGTEYVYAKEEKSSDDKSVTSKNEEYAEGVKKSGENAYIIIDTSNGQKALLVTEMAPKVRGVVIVCQGGSNSAVSAEIKRAVTTALDINESKVCVSPMA